MRSVVGSIAGAIICGMLVPAAQLAGQPQAPTLEGTYVLVPEQSDDIEAAIETGVAQMNFITRSVARGRLKKTNPAYQRIVIGRGPAHIEVVFDEREPLRMPVDGSATKWTREDGEVFDVRADWRGQELVQHYKAEDGERTNTFRIDQTGAALTLEVVVTSGRLPQPVTYSLAYRRS
jgi:hypothetical protein